MLSVLSCFGFTVFLYWLRRRLERRDLAFKAVLLLSMETYSRCPTCVCGHSFVFHNCGFNPLDFSGPCGCNFDASKPPCPCRTFVAGGTLPC